MQGQTFSPRTRSFSVPFTVLFSAAIRALYRAIFRADICHFLCSSLRKHSPVSSFCPLVFPFFVHGPGGFIPGCPCHFPCVFSFPPGARFWSISVHVVSLKWRGVHCCRRSSFPFFFLFFSVPLHGFRRWFRHHFPCSFFFPVHGKWHGCFWSA